jgi:nitrite reductase/ring-hydroxylating ferredoxin subunit
MERRDFLRGSLAAAGVFPFCCMTPPLPPNSVTFEDSRIVVKLAAVPELRRAGAVFSVVDESRKVNVLLIHAGRGRYVAMDRSCTHGGAQCTYNPKKQTVQCTSVNHAEFDLRGTLLGGRTHGNLRTYRTEVSPAAVTISLEGRA